MTEPASPEPGSPEPGSPEPAAGPVLAVPRSRRGLARWVVLLAVVAAMLAAGAVGLSLYDEATEPDRSTPAAAVDQFLQAALVDRDAARLSLFVCRGFPAATALRVASAPPGPGIQITWTDLVATPAPGGTSVTARVQFSVAGAGVSQRQIEIWRFALVEEDGWRVCSVSRGGSLNP